MRSDGVSPRVGGNARPVCLNSFGIGHGYFDLLCNHKITFFFLSKKLHHMMRISEDEDELDKDTLGKKVMSRL